MQVVSPRRRLAIGMIAALTLALALPGSASAAEPPASGTVSIEPAAADPEVASSLPAFVTAIGDALEPKGFTVLEEPGHAAFVVELGLNRVEVGTGTAKVATTGSQVLPGASRGSGVGVVIPLPTGKSALVPLQRTRLEIRIRKRGDNEVLWQGAAVTIRAAGTPKGQDEAVASALAQALLRSYPAQPEGVIGVP